MIYRREQPKTPSKRFRSVILNPIGTKITRKTFYTNFSKQIGVHFGTKVCYRRKKSSFKSKFNLYYGAYQRTYGVITEITLARRYKTFAGLITYSNGAVCCIPLFSGAYLGQLVKTWRYSQTPKSHLFANFNTGSIVPVAYLSITICFFNIMYSRNQFAWFCRAGGTFCTIVRFNIEKGNCTVKIPSGKFKVIPESSYATLGRNSNLLPRGIWLGKAGWNIRRGFRPNVRGVAMNPVDHPHGGRTKSNSPERTPWGKVAKFNK